MLVIFVWQTFWFCSFNLIQKKIRVSGHLETNWNSLPFCFLERLILFSYFLVMAGLLKLIYFKTETESALFLWIHLFQTCWKDLWKNTKETHVTVTKRQINLLKQEIVSRETYPHSRAALSGGKRGQGPCLHGILLIWIYYHLATILLRQTYRQTV